MERVGGQEAVERFTREEDGRALRRPHLHAERPARARHLAPDGAVADDAEALPAQERCAERLSVEPPSLALSLEPAGEVPRRA